MKLKKYFNIDNNSKQSEEAFKNGFYTIRGSFEIINLIPIKTVDELGEQQVIEMIVNQM